MKIFMAAAFLAGIIYNYSKIRKNQVSTKSKPLVIMVFALFILFSIYICFKYDNSISGYIVAFLASIYLYIPIFNQGISNNGVNLFLGGTSLLRFAKFEEIKDIKYDVKGNNELELKIHTYGNTFTQIYDNGDKVQVLEILNRKGIS